MSSGLTPTQDAWLRTQQMTETFSGFTAHEIATMPLDEFARLAGRQTIGQAATQAFDTEPPGRPRQEPAPAQSAPQPPAPEPGPPGMDPNSQEYFLAWRAQRQRGGEGRGIFDSVGSQSDEYTAALRAQAGRTGWTTGNVVGSPRLERRYARQEQPDTRPAVQRFSTPGNAFSA